MKVETLPSVRRVVDVMNGEVKPHPRNPRRGKVSAVKDSIKINGYYPSIFVQESTGYIIKGNHTFKALVELVQAGFEKLQRVEMNFVDIPDHDALRILLADNAASDFGAYHNESVFEILDELQTTELGLMGTLWEGDDLEYLRFALNKNPVIEAEDIETRSEENVKEKLAEENTIKDKIKDNEMHKLDDTLLLFPSKDEFGIPLLDIDMQADSAQLPFMIWSMQRTIRALPRGEVATLGFYCEDKAFENVWTNPNRIVEARVKNCVEVNFSTDSQSPRAFGLWQIYRKRWLARYWQSKGIKIIADVGFNMSIADDAFRGIPEGWKSYCNRGNVFTDAETARQYYLSIWNMCRERAGTDNIFHMIYGGGNVIKNLCNEYGWLWIPDEQSLIQGKFREDVKELEKKAKANLTEAKAFD